MLTKVVFTCNSVVGRFQCDHNLVIRIDVCREAKRFQGSKYHIPFEKPSFALQFQPASPRTLAVSHHCAVKYLIRGEHCLLWDDSSPPGIIVVLLDSLDVVRTCRGIAGVIPLASLSTFVTVVILVATRRWHATRVIERPMLGQ